MGNVYNMTGGGGAGIRLAGVAVTTPPAKTTYRSGQRFDPTGMVVTATYSNGAQLAATGCTVAPDGPLTDGITYVTIRYTEGGRSATANQSVTVLPVLRSIAVTTPPAKTQYRYGESFDPAGMVVTAAYSDGSTRAVTGYATSPASFAALGGQSVSVKYTEDGVSASAATPVTVAKATNTITLSPASLTLNASAKTGKITVKRKGDGVISATSSDTGVAKVSGVNQTTGEVTISSVNDKTGTATITVKAAEGTNYLAAANKTAAVKAVFREYLYGFDINLADSNPATRVSYPVGVDNYGFSPAVMNFSTDTFSYGSWPSTPGKTFMPRPCMLKFDGTVDYYLDPNDYAQKVDGSASDVADINYGGNAMMEWPKIYAKRWEENGVYHFRCSDIKVDDNYECWCSYDRLNNEIPHFYTPCFFGSKDSAGRLRSISGTSNWTLVGNANNELAAARANGDDWCIEVIADRLLVNDLLNMMFKSTDGQGTAGYGRVSSGNTSAIAPGTMNSKGLFWGTDDQVSGVKVFGMENLWGNMWRDLAGYIRSGNSQKVKITRGTKDGSTADDYNFSGAGYLTVADVNLSDGQISKMQTETYGRFPVAVGGSDSTYEADYIWYKYESTGIAQAGGYWRYAKSCGPYCFILRWSTSRYNDKGNGAALSCKPLASI